MVVLHLAVTETKRLYDEDKDQSFCVERSSIFAKRFIGQDSQDLHDEAPSHRQVPVLEETSIL